MSVRPVKRIVQAEAKKVLFVKILSDIKISWMMELNSDILVFAKMDIMKDHYHSRGE